MIANNDFLGTLHGLENLTTVDGSLYIMQNEKLESLAALHGLTSVGGDLHISANPELRDLRGLDNLVRIAGGLTIEANQRLADLGALRGLVLVAGEVEMSGDVLSPDAIAAEKSRLAASYAADLAVLDALASSAPYDDETGTPAAIGAAALAALEHFRSEGRRHHFPLLVEYALRTHWNNLRVTRLSREMPLASNPMLAEFVRLGDVAKYTTAHEGGWLKRQFHSQHVDPGYSSYQVYVWIKENTDWFEFTNADRIGNLLQQIDSSRMNGPGGGGACHYGCDWH